MPIVLVFARLRSLLFTGVTVLLLSLVLVSTHAPAFSFDPQQIERYARQRYGEKTVRGLQDWQQMLSDAAALDELEKLKIVNDFWNRKILQGEDITIWGQKDYWATPMESLYKGIADCEDFVIAKYFSLIKLGLDPNKLRLVYVQAQLGAQSIAHMVLGYYPTPQSEPLVLDSLIDRIQLAHLRPDLIPVFSFNALGVYMPGGKRSSIDRIGRWRDLLSRMQTQGFNP